MIHAFNFYCNRDLNLSHLMAMSFNKYCVNGSLRFVNTDITDPYKKYGNGSGWEASMMKLKAISDTIKSKNVKDDDFILSVDSDVVFTSDELFKYIDPAYGIIGTKHRPEFKTMLGQWSHMSGAAIFIRGDIAKTITNLRERELGHIRYDHFKKFDLTENEDVVLSYLAKYVDANYFDLGTVSGLSSGNFEADIKSGNTASFYHLNYCPTYFLGEPVSGKWDIPSVLKKKGIEL